MGRGIATLPVAITNTRPAGPNQGRQMFIFAPTNNAEAEAMARTFIRLTGERIALLPAMWSAVKARGIDMSLFHKQSLRLPTGNYDVQP